MSSSPRCGRYHLLDQIANGSGREVWRAFDPRSQSHVAIKRFTSPSRHPLAGQQLHDEVRAAFEAAVERGGDALVALHEIGLDGDCTWVASELLSTPTLADIQAAGELTSSRVANLIGVVARVVDALHDNGFVHTNLKLSNVFIDDADKAKLADPFLVGLLGPRLLEEPLPEAQVNHIAPELVSGSAVGPLSDQYAVGVIAYRLLANALPFDDVGSLDYFFATVYLQPVALPVRVDGLGAEVDRAVRRALSKAPRDRFPDCGAFARALASAVGTDVADRADASRLAVSPRPPAASLDIPAAQQIVAEPTTAEPTTAEPIASSAELEPTFEEPRHDEGPVEVGAAEIPVVQLTLSPHPVADDQPASSPVHRRSPGDKQPVDLGSIDNLEISIPRGGPARQSPSSVLEVLWRSVSGLWRGRSGRLDHAAWAERDAYNADWRRARRRSVRESDEARELADGPLDPEWDLRVLTDREDCQIWVNGIYASEAPGDLLLRGRSNDPVKLELRRGDFVVASNELVLHPLMPKRWDADARRHASQSKAEEADAGASE